MNKDTKKTIVTILIGVTIGVLAAQFVAKNKKGDSNFSSACGCEG